MRYNPNQKANKQYANENKANDSLLIYNRVTKVSPTAGISYRNVGWSSSVMVMYLRSALEPVRHEAGFLALVVVVAAAPLM